jgi:hypothetical protein
MSNPVQPSLIERLLCKLFPYTDILRDDSPDIYLRRFFLYPRDKDFGKNKGKGRLYLHKFYRGDEDPHLHDHPWSFTSLILTRGYWEETPLQGSIVPLGYTFLTSPDGTEHRKMKFYPRFSLLRRPDEWKHRVILKDNTPVWTIVKTAPKSRSWGFWIRETFCPWRQYNNGVCWCEEAPKNEVFD